MSEVNEIIDAGDDFDIKKFIGQVLAHWKLYAICLAIAICCAWLYIHYSNPLYKANAQILIQNDKKGSASPFLQSTGGVGNFSDFFTAKNNIADQLAILETPDLFKKVIPVLNLNVAYFHKGNIRNVELYDDSPFYISFFPKSDSIPGLKYEIRGVKNDVNSVLVSNESGFSKTAKFEDTLLVGNGKIVVSKTGRPLGEDTYFFTLVSNDAAVASLMSKVSVSSLDKESNVISLDCSSDVPRKAEDILGTLINKYIERSLNEKNRIADSLISFIDERINLIADNLNNIEARIQGFKQENKLTNIEAQSTALIANTSDYYNKLNDIDVQLNVMNTMLDAVEKDSKRPVPALVTDPTFVSLSEQYNVLLAQRQKLLLSTTEGNPLIKNIDKQMEGLRADIVRNLQNQQKALQISRQKIAGSNAQISSLVANAPVQERKFIDLSRERDVKQAIYLFLLQKKEETSITKASNIPGATVIKEPKCSIYPFFPNPTTAYGIALALGLVVPFSFVWLKGLFNNRINTTEDISGATKVPVIAEIGHSEQAGLLSLKEQGRSALAEQFRVFRTNMDFITGSSKCSTILITSTTSGEGKSFIAANLAQIYGYSGKRVLLMELDLRKPKISQMLGLDNDIGFSNYIIGDKELSEFIKPVPGVDNVYLLSSGPIPPNPAELLMHKKVVPMFASLAQQFDVVIIDSPPIGVVTDAQIIGAYADVSLYIIRPGYSLKDSIRIVNNISENKKLPSFYLTVNDVKSGNTYIYGYGYQYGYGYFQENGASKKQMKFLKKQKS